MTDLPPALAALRRPRLLIRAARYGLADYNRSRDLKRLLRAEAPPAPAAALDRLMEEEARLDEIRRETTASYSVARHIEVLIAIMAEARLLPKTRQVS